MSNPFRRFVRRMTLYGVLMLFCALPASAERLADTIYVAGNGDLYPLEYYANGQYQGAFPELLEAISTETGLEFVYLPPQEGVTQQERARNRQAELISCVVRTQAWSGVEEAAFTKALYTVPLEDGTSAEVCFVLTGLFPEKQAEQFLAALERHAPAAPAALQPEDLNAPTPTGVILGAAAALGALGALLIWWIYRRKEVPERHVVDEPLLCGNLDTLDPIARPLWYLALFRVRDVSAIRESLTGWIRPTCMPAVLNDGEAALLFTVPGEEQAAALVRNAAAGLCAESASLLALRDCPLPASALLACARRACGLAAGREETVLICSGPVMEDLIQHEMLRRQLRTALEQDQFELYLQPIVRAEDGVPVGAEALSRWDHPSLGFLTPDRFIQLIREMELETEFDRCQLRRVCRELARWCEAGREDLRLHYNISCQSLSVPGAAGQIRELLAEYALPPQALALEITGESLKDQPQILETLRQLHQMQIHLALEHFGVGAAGEEALRLSLFDVVKLDASLLRNAREPAGKLRLRETLALAHTGGAKAVCEGVETAADAALVRALGCEMMQGYDCYRPMPQREARRLLLGQAPACVNPTK